MSWLFYITGSFIFWPFQIVGPVFMETIDGSVKVIEISIKIIKRYVTTIDGAMETIDMSVTMIEKSVETI